MLGDKEKPKPKGRYCANDKCRGWFRPSKYRSAGKNLEYCSVKCLEEVQKATESGSGTAAKPGGRSWLAERKVESVRKWPSLNTTELSPAS